MNQILTTRQAAEYLKIHPETLRDYTRRGFIKASRFGNKLRFSTIDLDSYFEQQCVKGGNDACCTEEKIQDIGGLRSKSTDEEYSALLGLTTKPKLKEQSPFLCRKTRLENYRRTTRESCKVCVYILG